MGVFDFLFGKKKEAESEAESEAEPICLLGVSDVIGVDDNATDLIIEGFVFKISDILTKVFIRDIIYKNCVRIKI